MKKILTSHLDNIYRQNTLVSFTYKVRLKTEVKLHCQLSYINVESWSSREHPGSTPQSSTSTEVYNLEKSVICEKCTLQCLPQRIKSTFIKILLNRATSKQRGLRSKIFFQKTLIDLRQVIVQPLLHCTIFQFLEHCGSPV